jgi:hypothetical protein
MKKFFIGLTIAFCLTACGNCCPKTDKTETPVETVDTLTVVDSTVVDTLVVE